jgi:hypothetical protein
MSVENATNTSSSFKQSKLDAAIARTQRMLDIMEPETKDLDLSWDQRRLLALNNLKKLLLEAKDQLSLDNNAAESSNMTRFQANSTNLSTRHWPRSSSQMTQANRRT